MVKKSDYSVLIFWLLVNILIWSWSSEFFQSRVFKTKQMGQPVRVLEEMQAESVTVLKTVQKGYAERAYPPED